MSDNGNSIGARRRPMVAALGSSFAAGPTIEPVANLAAMRSGRNYPHLVADSLGADLVDLTVSGATTANILREPQTMVGGAEFAPQIDGLPVDADLVTVTAGGNDLRFIGSMLFCAWARLEPGGLMEQMLAQGLPGGLADVTDDEVDLAAQGLVDIVSAVRSRAKRARVVLVDYLTVVTENLPVGAGEVFTADELALFVRTQAALGRAYRIAADRSGAELLAMSEVSAGHGLGSDQAWVFGFKPTMQTTAGSFHPNGAGMQAVAHELLDLVC